MQAPKVWFVGGGVPVHPLVHPQSGVPPPPSRCRVISPQIRQSRPDKTVKTTDKTVKTTDKTVKTRLRALRPRRPHVQPVHPQSSLETPPDLDHSSDDLARAKSAKELKEHLETRVL